MRFIILGDSYTFGHGCSDREYYFDHKLQTFVGDSTNFIKNIPSIRCWASLLKQRYSDIEVENLAVPGNSNQGLFRNLMHYYSTTNPSTDDVIMFLGTYPDRIDISSLGSPEDTLPWVMGWDKETNDSRPTPYNIAKKMYISHLFNDTIGINLSITGLLSAYAFAKLHRTHFIWSLPICRYPAQISTRVLSTMEDSRIDHITSYDFSTRLDLKFNSTCIANDNHTNDKGHQIYFENVVLPKLAKLSLLN